MIIICVQDACFAPLVTTTAFILKGLSGLLSVPPANRFPQNCRQKFPIFEFIKFKFIHGLKLQGCSSFSPTSSPRGNKTIMIVGSNKENIWLSVCLGQIASAYISIFPKPLRSRQEHGPAKGKKERETARMQNA